MKIKLLIRSALFIPAVCFFAGCQKEAVPSPNNSVAAMKNVQPDKPAPHKHQLKGQFSSGYYSFIPDLAAGYVAPNPAPAWYPGVATKGHMSLLGDCDVFVNLYATMGAGGLQGAPASLNLFFADQLKEVGYEVPDEVAAMMFDRQGNSIWARAMGAITLTPVSNTRVNFSFNATILGGTGKFANASGSFVGTGYFNPQNTNDVGFDLPDGTIIY